MKVLISVTFLLLYLYEMQANYVELLSNTSGSQESEKSNETFIIPNTTEIIESENYTQFLVSSVINLHIKE